MLIDDQDRRGQSLKWTPIINALTERINQHDNPILIIAPFIKRESLAQILDTVHQPTRIQVISRWKSDDIVSGVSDISVYPMLNKLGISLYIHNNIHLKLFVFESNIGFHTSGNVTSHGLGTITNANIEIGCFISLTGADWQKLYKLLSESRLVDDGVYEIYKRFYNDHEKERKTYKALEIPEAWNKDYTINALPASETPGTLYNYYVNETAQFFSPEEVRKCVHDMILYELPAGKSKDEFYGILSERFRNQNIVKELVNFIRAEGSARFGAINEWIHKKCTDVPLPYKWEIKANTRILYNWLSTFYHQISWKIPGKRSQVIFWRE